MWYGNVHRSSNYRHKLKKWSDKHLKNQIRLTYKQAQAYYLDPKNQSVKNPDKNGQQIERMSNKLNVLLEEKSRRLRKREPYEKRKKQRSQSAIANMITYWQRKRTNLNEKRNKLNYYHNLRELQAFKNRKLNIYERRKLYKMSTRNKMSYDDPKHRNILRNMF